MKGIVFALSMLMVIYGIDVVALSTGLWWIFGDAMILAGLCCSSVVVYRS